MAAIVPEYLPDTASLAGFDHLDPITQWFRGGSGTAGAQATGLNDDSRYGLDLQNVGSGGLALRATSGNSTYQLRVNNSGITMFGGIGVTGAGVFTSTVSALQLTSTATAGAPFVVNSTSAVSSLNADMVDGLHAASFSLTSHTHAYLPLTGGTVSGDLVVTGELSVNGNVTLGDDATDAVTVNGDLTVRHDVVIGNNTAGSFLVGSQTLWVDPQNGRVGIGTNSPATSAVLDVNGDVNFQDNVDANTMAITLDLDVNRDLFVSNNLTVNGAFQLGSSTGAGSTTASWGGAFKISDGSSTRFVPYKATWP